MADQRVVNVFGTQGYHKNYIKDQYTYPVLAIDRLPKEEKEKIRAAIKTLATAKEAQKMIGGEGWSYEILDQRGRVGMLKYRGVEVSLFLERQMIQEQPVAGDPVPECVLKDPDNLWQRLDVMGPSAKQANLFIKREVEGGKERIALLETRCVNLEKLTDDLESKLQRKQSSVDTLNEKIEKIYARFLPDDRLIARLPGYRYLTPVQVKQERAKAASKKKKKAVKP